MRAAGFAAIESRAGPRRHRARRDRSIRRAMSVSEDERGDRERLDRARRSGGGAGGAGADDRWLAASWSSRPTGSTGSPAIPSTRRRSRASTAQGARRRQALGGHVLLAAGDAGAGRRARPAHRSRGQRAAAGTADAGRRQPRTALPAGLPRGRRAARRAPARSGRWPGRCARSSRPRPTAAASRRLRSSTRCRTRSVAGADLAIDGGELTGLPSTVVDITAIDADGSWRILREGAVSEGDLASALAAFGVD